MIAMDVGEKNRIVGTGSITFEDGDREVLHVHAGYAQLKWPTTGVASVRTPSGIFVAAPARAVWIPAGERHGGMYTGQVLEQSLYVHEEYREGLPGKCCLIAVSPRLATMISEALASRSGYRVPSREDDEAVVGVLRQEIVDSGRRPLELPLPEGSLLQPVLDTVLRSPSDPRALAAWAKTLGRAERSLRREFSKQTGMSFSEWRKRARVLSALRRLCVGHEVSEVAAVLGYESTSAFVYMFRATLGISPGRYYRSGKMSLSD
jgi:AraC-like DNA-binding protein